MQPIQMTRAEYEKKYGVKPVFSTSTLDTTPTRVRMTREEYNQIYGPEKKNTILENLNPLSQTNINRIADIPSDIKESYAGIKEAGQTAAKSVSDIWKNKDLNVVQKSAATLPGFFSGGVNMAATAALAPVKLLTTDEFEKNVASTLGKAINDTYNADIPLLSKSMKDIYDGMSDDNKFIVSKLFAPVANVITSVTTAGKAVPLAEQGVKTVAKNVPDVGATLKKAADNFSFRGEEKALRSVVDEIAKVEEKYAPIRKSNKFAKDVEGSRTRIAQSGVLSKAVDESGKINGEVASKLYKQMTIDDTEGLVRNLLKDENAVISIDSLKEVMENTILKSRLEGNDLVKALDSIDGELKGLRIRGDEAGNIPLYKVHDAKISATEGINYLSPATDKAYRKALAKTYRQVVEKESKIKMDVEGKQAGIKEINDRLSIYLDDIRRIKALDGRIVDRGKLGKYASSLAGTGIGMAVGAIGGPLASAAGGAIGGKVASKITSTSMQNTFKKGVKGGVPEDKILKAAKLRVADKPLVAPKGVPKTKAIKETEDLIKKNVEMQKTAIKANDFTLVAKLKEIYAKLVAKLKDLVTEAVEAQKNPQTGQKGSVDFFAPLPKKSKLPKTVTPESVAKAMDAEDFKRLTMVIDDPMTAKLDDQTKRMLENMKLDKATDDELVSFAKEVIDEFDGVATRPVLQEGGLLEEAKGKTLDEFLKAQGTPVYHGTRAKFTDFKQSESGEIGKGVYFYDDSKKALDHVGDEGRVVEAYFDGKLATMDDFRKTRDRLKDNSWTNSATIDDLEKQGFVGIKRPEGNSTVYNIFDPKNIKTKESLEDIWKQANRTASADGK